MANLSTYQDYFTQTRYDPQRSISTAKLWRHQRAALEFSLATDNPHLYAPSAQGKTLLYSGTGTGKTLYALQYLEHFEGLRLVLCPRRAIVVWKADYDAFYGDVKPFALHVMTEGTSQDKAKELARIAKHQPNTVVVVNYETAVKLPLNKYQWSAAVADEAHRLASYKGVQSRNLAVMCAHIPNKVAMSGTPLYDGYERVYGIHRWLDPILPANSRAYPTSHLFGTWDNFLNTYCTTYTKGYARIIKGYRNLTQLAEELKPFTLLIRTEDVLDLPEAVYRRYRVPLTKETREQYKSLSDDALIEVFNTEGSDFILAPHVLTRLLKLQQLTSSGELHTETGTVQRFDITPRLDTLRGILESIGDEPCVIFTRFIRDVELISQIVLEMTGEKAYRLTGSVDEHEAWQAGAGRVLIANLSAGSEGVRLFRAHHVIDWSLSFSLKQYEQSRARCRRKGQQSGTVYFHQILSEDTIDETIFDRLQEKARDVQDLDKELMKENEA